MSATATGPVGVHGARADRDPTPAPAPDPGRAPGPCGGPGSDCRFGPAGTSRAGSLNGWLPGAPCTPAACVDTAPSAVPVPRAVLRLTAVAVLVLAGIALCPVAWAFHRLRGKLPAGPVRRWCRAIVRAAGVRVSVTGSAPSGGGLLLVSHHISWLDIPLLAAVRPARMLAKTEIRRWPVAGALVALGGALFIERDRLRALPDTVARIARALRDGAAVVAFPEGSTWCGRARGRFHHAVFQAALDAAVPVQPVRLRYRTEEGTDSTVPAFVGEDTLLASLWRVVSARGLVAEVEVGTVIEPGPRSDRRTLAQSAEAAVTWASKRPERDRTRGAARA